jgi:type IV pilus biogenesis protein CpaD/CtpE
LSDPKFRVGKVVVRVIENILVKVATSPFSLLGALFGGGGEELGQQDFAPGSAELTVTDKARLDSLLKGLYARPALNLEITGSVDTDGDREGLQRAALDREIRTRIWMKLRKSEQATNSVDALVLAPDVRAKWVKKLYAEAVADGKITPQLVAANSNLVAYAAQVLPRKIVFEKGATKLKSGSASQTITTTGTAAYQTKLLPPPDPTEAVLLVTFPVNDGDLETLAANRAKTVQAYLLASGKVTAARLFLKQGELRRNGSKVMLSFR